MNEFENEFQAEAFGHTASAYCRRLIGQRLARVKVLDRLIASGKCKDRSAASSIYTYVTKPPKTPGPRRFARTNPGDTILTMPVPPHLMERLQCAAVTRDVAPKVLAQRILVTVLSDNMIDAVLDDKDSA